MHLPSHTDEPTERDLSPDPAMPDDEDEDDDDEDDIAELDDDVGTDENGHETLKLHASPGQAT